MQDQGTRSIENFDGTWKRRRDFHLTDPRLIANLRARVGRRICPEIKKAFQMRLTRIERDLVARYDSETGGHFGPHRDDTGISVAHRRFAVSINLNADFDGGEIAFPEYAPRSFKAAPGAAVVFSASILHQVSRVTRGPALRVPHLPVRRGGRAGATGEFARHAGGATPASDGGERIGGNGSSPGRARVGAAGAARLHLRRLKLSVRSRAVLGSCGMKSNKIAVIGLGAMGYGIAASLARKGWPVVGADTNSSAAARFADAFGAATGSVREAASGADVVILVVVNAAQCEAVLFGEAGALASTAPDALIMSCVTMDPAQARSLGARIEAQGRAFVDAPTSGGPARAADGALTLLTSGPEAAMKRAEPIFEAIAAKVYRLGDEAGAGSAFKMINQHLAGIHIAAACEAIAFAKKLGLDLSKVYEVITASAGNSWMFENRVPHILDGDYTPKSAVNIFTKDLGILSDMARAESFPTPLAASALQMFLMTAASGMGRDDDASVARLYAKIAGVDLNGGKDQRDRRQFRAARSRPALTGISGAGHEEGGLYAAAQGQGRVGHGSGKRDRRGRSACACARRSERDVDRAAKGAARGGRGQNRERRRDSARSSRRYVTPGRPICDHGGDRERIRPPRHHGQ